MWKGKGRVSDGVAPPSPADKAGIKENDIILAVNGKRIDEKNEVSDLVQTANVGDEIEIELIRKKKKINVRAKLEEHK